MLQLFENIASVPIPLGKSSSQGHSCEAVASKEEEEVAKVVGKALKKNQSGKVKLEQYVG